MSTYVLLQNKPILQVYGDPQEVMMLQCNYYYIHSYKQRNKYHNGACFKF